MTLICASNLAVSLVYLGERVKAAVLLRATLTARTRTSEPNDQGTLATERQLVGVLRGLGEHAEAEALG